MDEEGELKIIFNFFFSLNSYIFFIEKKQTGKTILKKDFGRSDDGEMVESFNFVI